MYNEIWGKTKRTPNTNYEAQTPSYYYCAYGFVFVIIDIIVRIIMLVWSFVLQNSDWGQQQIRSCSRAINNTAPHTQGIIHNT